ncbi:glycosyltransferase [uncultured Eubacterium sp.]|uniref:glycosyltransferase family 2 protein n=1 Tax=uncultured Eubacterium sp. TaxID=165185 RepID=UPI0025FD038C|nr:glycosyltransferase [uncultured Eubacterium sp.]
MSDELGDLISVIVPVFNVEKYLVQCLESIINQTYKNLEIILCDDGSFDSSSEICDRYKILDNRVQVIHKKNGGLSDARNAGIDIAKGKYLTFVDSDDFILPNMIELLYDICITYQTDFAMCQCMECNDEDDITCLCLNPSKKNVVIFENIKKMEAYLVTNKIETTAWKKLYRKNLFDDLRFPKGKIHEDAFTTYLLVDKAKRIGVTNEIGYVYRRNPLSIMNRGFSLKRLDIIEAKNKQLKFIKNKYPKLYKYGCTDLIYACNFCLKEMELGDFYDENIEKMIQKTYRQYSKYYLKAHNVSFKGKLFTLCAFIKTKFARMVLKGINKN